MAYAIMRKLGSREDYCYIKNGVLNLTQKSLADDYPHLIRTWPTKAAAKGVRTRILNKYHGGMYGCVTDFSIIEIN